MRVNACHRVRLPVTLALALVVPRLQELLARAIASPIVKIATQVSLRMAVHVRLTFAVARMAPRLQGLLAQAMVQPFAKIAT